MKLTLAEYQKRYPRMVVSREIDGIDQAALRARFRYRAGRLIDRATGKPLGGDGGKGKRRKWRRNLLSRWVWLYFRGWVPIGTKYVIDHIDNNPLNDRFENLQLLHFVENLNKDQDPERPSIFDMTTEQRRAAQRAGIETQRRLGLGFFDPANRAKGQTPAARAKAQATRRERGIKSPFADPAIRAKAQATRRERGIKSPFADPAIRAKAQATRRERGIKSPFADPAVRAKAQATRRERGIKSPFADPAVLTPEQRRAAQRAGIETQRRRGLGFFDPANRAKGQTPEARAKAQATRRERGIKSPFADPAIRAKAQATQKRLGVGVYDPATRAKAHRRSLETRRRNAAAA